MRTPREKFQELLKKLFQFDCAELDFGIYRIMNQKRAVIERFIRTLKEEGLRRILVPLTLEKMLAEANAIIAWYNTCRPHTTLGGRTPHGRYRRVASACRRPRWEPRPHWPSDSPSASHQVKVRSRPGVNLKLIVDFHQGQEHLPIVVLERSA